MVPKFKHIFLTVKSLCQMFLFFVTQKYAQLLNPVGCGS